MLTLFTSPLPQPSELLKVLVTRPRMALAIIRFCVRGVAPVTKAFRRGNDLVETRLHGDAALGSGRFAWLSEERKAYFLWTKDHSGSGYSMIVEQRDEVPSREKAHEVDRPCGLCDFPQEERHRHLTSLYRIDHDLSAFPTKGVFHTGGHLHSTRIRTGR